MIAEAEMILVVPRCPMSHSGQPLPSRDFCGTAALPLKPDIALGGWHGRKVPNSDIAWHLLSARPDL